MATVTLRRRIEAALADYLTGRLAANASLSAWTVLPGRSDSEKNEPCVIAKWDSETYPEATPGVAEIQFVIEVRSKFGPDADGHTVDATEHDLCAAECEAALEAADIGGRLSGPAGAMVYDVRHESSDNAADTETRADQIKVRILAGDAG